MKLRPNRALAAAFALAATWGHAQTVDAQATTPRAVKAPPASRPDPLDARAPVAPLVHRSALGAWRSVGDVPVGSWKDANETVNRIGGWRAYAREAAAPAAPTQTAPASSAPTPGSTSPAADGPREAPKARGHEGHGDHAAPRKP